MSLSQDIVGFISNLMPLYIHDQVNGVNCARRLSDGSLICPIAPIDEDDENEFVTILWQGNTERKTELQGIYIASLAVAQYVELHHMTATLEEKRVRMEHMSNHFTVKTGQSLIFETPDQDLMRLVGKASSKVGKEVVTEVLKKLVGF